MRTFAVLERENLEDVWILMEFQVIEPLTEKTWAREMRSICLGSKNKNGGTVRSLN